MNKYSIWYMPYNKRYLLTHPWQWFKCAWRCIKDAWRRSVYGWTYGDVWDWDNWFMHVAPEMLRYMADHGSAYPGHPPFETPEKWHEWLHNIADMIETGREDWQEEHNEYYEKYMNNIMHRPFASEEKDENGLVRVTLPPRTVLDDNYFRRAKELSDQGEKNIRYALNQVAEHLYDCWD